MALEEYRRKRDFGKTPEPAGGRAARRKGKGLQFVIQKHAARRLHYDFRLEWDGVMWSWAVPKGPSYDPKEKRLAVHTEDHPLAYNQFEGIIPAGEYGGGTVLIWDRGVWQPEDDDPAEAHRKGMLKFRLDGEKLHGRWALIKLRGRRDAGKDNWLLVKEKDETAIEGSGSAIVDEHPESVVSGRDIETIAEDADRVWHSNRSNPADGDGTLRKSAAPASPALDPKRLKGAKKGKLPASVEPLLASPAEAAPRGEEWLHELKFDGYRILAFLEGGHVKLLSRNGLDWTDRFPRLKKDLPHLPAQTALVDGEVVHLDDDGASNFGGLQKALSEGRTDELVYYAFDLLHVDGWDLAGVPLEQRKAALKTLIDDGRGNIRYSDHHVGQGPDFYRSACNMNLEGIVSKRRDSLYRPGRSKSWVKVKCLYRDEFLVIGFTDPAGSRVGFGALILGYYDGDGNLRYAGRCGTGYDTKLLSELRRRLDKLAKGTKPKSLPKGAPLKGVHWVAPELVAEVQYTGWTTDGVLRHAVFLGLREDKSPDEIVRPGPGAPTDGGKARIEVGWDGSVELTGMKLTNAEKVLYPGEGITKLDLAQYFAAVCEPALRHLAHRPLTLVRCPDGQGKPCFYQKHVGSGVPDALKRVEVAEREGGTGVYLMVEDLAGLLATVQMGALELHPWGSTADDIERPDRLYFDLDPDQELPWERIVEASLDVRRRLEEIGLESWPKTTGGKGLHVVVPIKPKLDWDEAKAFTKAVVDGLVRDYPERYTGNLAKKARGSKIFIDYLRNGRGNTAVGAFSPRARPGAPVSMPLSWAEVEAGVRSDAFNVFNAPDRMKRLERDPWDDFFKSRQTITAKVLHKVGLG
jgi:bifunctional non-homologous end joining protein LigD